MKFFPTPPLASRPSFALCRRQPSCPPVSGTRSDPLNRCGVAAVPIFFVLSGFVMFQVVAGSREGFREALGFWVKRVMRIFPAYWFFLAITALFVHAGYDTTDNAGRPSADWWGGWSCLFIGRVEEPMAAAWSLAFEVMFYYALTFVVWNRTWGGATLGVYFLWSLLIDHWLPLRVFGLSLMNVLFLFGLLLGAASQYHPRTLSRATPVLFVGLFLCLVYVAFGFSWYHLIDRLAAMLIVAGVLGLEHSYKPALHRLVQTPLQFLGTISFSLYVGHTIVQSILRYVVGTPTPFTVLLYIGLPILVAFFSFRLIEKPAMDLAKSIDARFIVRHPVKEVAATKELEIRRIAELK